MTDRIVQDRCTEQQPRQDESVQSSIKTGFAWNGIPGAAGRGSSRGDVEQDPGRDSRARVVEMRCTEAGQKLTA